MNSISANFWQTKSLLEMNTQEWEALCDGCGKCCFRKFIDEEDIEEKIYFTRIACNQLNLQTGKCNHYACRFELEDDCIKLTKENLIEFSWLPKTCSYRLLHEGKALPDWHPLISGKPESVARAGILIKNGIHEQDIIDWFDFVVDEF